MLSLEVLIVALTAVAVSIIVCTLEVLLVVDIIYPTKPLSEITVMFGSIPFIAGLPEETVDMFKYSLDEVIKLDPENITVHSMCVKRAASLRFSDAELAKANDMNEMLSYTQKHMEKTGRKPYYMYRQKNISGNLENVGYAKDGCMSTYNINIMEEKQTIIALGGGGSTKIVMDDRIERVFNFKDPLEYIRRFDEILKKKDEILDILAGEKNG